MKRIFLFILLLTVPIAVMAQNPVTVVGGIATIDASICGANAAGNSCSFKVILSANTTISVINPRGGQALGIFFIQNATGGWTLTWPSYISSPPAISLVANAPTLVNLQYDNSGGTWSVIGGSGSGGGIGQSFGGSPSSAYTFSVVGGTTYATNNKTGTVDYSGTDAAVVINSVLTANASTCGTLFFKNGIYPLNSVTQEGSSTTILLGGNLFYSIAIPANAGSTNQYCQWHLEGESAAYVSGSALQAAGTIFDLTATAVTGAGASTNMIAALWHRPDTANSIGNDVFVKNITIRFPNNTRGNECAFCMYEAGTVDYENDTATLATNPGTPLSPNIVVATAGTNRMVGFTTTKNAHNNWQHFKETWAVGYDIGYDLESEHVVMDSATAFFNANAGFYGRISQAPATIIHPGIWFKVTDQENVNGFTLGAGMGAGSEFDLFGYDLEYLTSGAFSRVSDFTETNCNYTSGIITYQAVQGGVGVKNRTGLWNAGCGKYFSMLQADTPVNYSFLPVSDTFTHPNSAALPPGWLDNSGGGSSVGFKIASNAAVTGNVAQGAIASFQGTTFNNDQFSKATYAGTVDANFQAGVVVRAVAGSLTPGAGTATFYRYRCAGVNSTTAIQYYLNNVFQSTIGPTPTHTCTAGDTMELDAIGSTLIGYYNGVLDIVGTDTNLTSGFPGIMSASVANAPTFTNWTGGSLPTKTGTDSIYAKPAVHPSYLTQTNCSSSAAPAVCGSAAAGSVVIAAAGTTVTVNTTAVTANSQIFLSTDDTLGTKLGVTCNSTLATLVGGLTTSARTAGTSFQITSGTTPAVNPLCISYLIVN